MARRLMASGLAWSVVVSIGLSIWILVSLQGRQYYATPLAVRGYAPAHRLLRPSGPAGQVFGLIGAAMMLMPFFYTARKKLPLLKRAGSLKSWLEVHLFCGVVGPVLITFHTTFKFNGIVSAGYWSMVAVMLSGFVGRYLYVRIPRSIRGHELTRAELDSRANELKGELAETAESAGVVARIESFERSVVPVGRLSFRDLFLGELLIWGRRRALEKDLERAGLPSERRARIVQLVIDRCTLLRRLAYLQRTKQLFELWHVFHLPLVYVMAVIVTLHVGITLYMGYVPFRW